MIFTMLILTAYTPVFMNTLAHHRSLGASLYLRCGSRCVHYIVHRGYGKPAALVSEMITQFVPYYPSALVTMTSTPNSMSSTK